jgi:hypothetical protein
MHSIAVIFEAKRYAIGAQLVLFWIELEFLAGVGIGMLSEKGLY